MMYRLVAVFAALFLVAALLGGCSPAQETQQESSSQSSSQQEESQPEEQRLVVADAGMYRGEVYGVTEDHFYAVQVPGRNYGEDILSVSIGENTRFSFDQSTLKDGDYIEFYYGDLMESYPAQTEAIAVNRLPDAEMCVFNGEIVELTEEEGNLSLLLKRIGSEEEVLFRTGDSTNIYLNVDELKAGDKVSVLFSGAVALSLPGQATAQEIAPYTVEEMADYLQWVGEK